jgi:hypothetical protein
MKRKNFKRNKEKRIAAGALRRKRTPQAQLALINEKGYRAEKERKKIAKKLSK